MIRALVIFLILVQAAQATGWTHVGTVSTQTTVTGTINTGAANVLVVSLSFNGGTVGTLTDTYSNTWIPLSFTNGVTNYVWYCIPGSKVGVNHTVTLTGGDNQTAIFFSAFTFTSAAKIDTIAFQGGFISGGGSSSVTPTNTITPTAANALVVSVFQCSASTNVSSVGSGLTIPTNGSLNGNGSQFGGGIAYLDQSTAAAIAPTWTGNNNTNFKGTAVFSFVVNSGGGATAITRRFVGMGR